ncbi:MAG: ElyC/SanA/YdcF family protein [Acidobacteriota bacterium]
MARRLVLLGVVGTVVALGAVNAWILRRARPFIYPRPEDAPVRQAVMVLGAHVFVDGGLSSVLDERVRTGVEVYRAGKAGKILLTGDHGRTTYDEVNAMRRAVLAAGVPESDVFMDHAGFSTYESMYRARDVFGVSGMVVVTQPFHMARALYTARSLGIDAVGVEAVGYRYASAVRLRWTARESIARVKALFQVKVTHPRPKYLGPRIPITGDGRVTVDARA